MYTNKTKSDETKTSFMRVLYHLAGKQIWPILQLPGSAQSHSCYIMTKVTDISYERSQNVMHLPYFL